MLSISYLSFALSNSYALMLTTALFIGFGLGTYHPQGIGILSLAFKKKKGVVIGINGIGGSLGFIFAPIIMGYLLSKFSLNAYYIVAIPGIVIAFIIYMVVHVHEEKTETKITSTITKGLILLAIVAAVVPFFSRGIASFLPAYFYSKGSNVLNANLKASVMLMAGIIAQPLGGLLSDKFGRRIAISAAYLLMGLFLVLFIETSSLIHLFLMGFFMSFSVPVRLAFATEAGGQKINTNIAIIYGTSMIGATVSPTIMGALIDSFGFHTAFSMDVILAVLGGILIWFVKPAAKT